MPTNKILASITASIAIDPLPDDVIDAWDSDHVHTSRQYWKHLGGDARMLVIHEGGHILMATPLRVCDVRIDFGAGPGGPNILTVRIPGVEVLGSRVEALCTLRDPIGTLFGLFPAARAIVFPGLNPGGPSGTQADRPVQNFSSIHPWMDAPDFYATHMNGSDRRFLFHSPRGIRMCHVSSLPNSFGAYLDGMGSKGRNDIKRKVKKLEARGLCRLDVIDHPGHCDGLKADLDSLGVRLAGRAVGDGGVTGLKSLAGAGLLRCFVLRSGRDVGAVVLGVKWCKTYYLDSTHTNKSLLAFSPGTVMRHMMFQDLIRCGVEVVDYGYGEPGRVNSITDLEPRIHVMAFRDHAASRILVGSHRVCHRMIGLYRGFRERRKAAIV